MDPRKKRPTEQDIRHQRELFDRLAIEDIDKKFQDHLRNNPPKTPHSRDGPKEG